MLYSIVAADLIHSIHCFLTTDISPHDSTSSLLVSRKELVKSDFLSVLYIDAPDVCWPFRLQICGHHLFTPACVLSLYFIYYLYIVSLFGLSLFYFTLTAAILLK